MRLKLNWKLLISMVALGFGAVGMSAQQAPQYSLYMLNRYQFNPAYAGLDGSLSINGSYRAQWIDIPGNPVQQNLNAHLPIYILNGGLGLAIDHETIGAENTLRVRASYNYVQDLPTGFLSAGLAVGFHQKSLDGAELRAPEGEYEGNLIIHNDANLPTTTVSGFAPELAAGVYFAGEFFDLGVALTDFIIGDITMQGARFEGKSAVNIFGEYFIEGLGQFNLYPTFLARTDFANTQIEIGIRAEYDDFIMLGVGLRGYSGTTIDALPIYVGLKVSSHLNIAYAYDVTLSALNDVSSGSHELVVSYNLNRRVGAGVPPPIIYSPRFY